MSAIVVIGGTGYAGRNIVAEAVARGHQVRSISRNPPAVPLAGVDYLTGSLLDPEGLRGTLTAADAVVVAVSPRGAMADRVRPGIAALAAALPDGSRLGVVGGAGGSRLAPGGPRLVELGGDGFPPEVLAEGSEMAAVADDLEHSGKRLDWFLVHPPMGFMESNPGTRTGRYRTGGEVMVAGTDGQATLSGPDLGVVVVDEIETPRHHGERFTAGY